MARNQGVTFEVLVDRANGIPHIVSIRPLLIPDQRRPAVTTMAKQIVKLIRSRVQSEVNRFNGWHYNTVNNRVSGILNGMNVQTGTAVADDGNFKSMTEYPRLGALSYTQILSIVSRIQQSSSTLTISDIEFRFTIIPESILAGASPKVKIPPWVPQIKFRATWQGHTDKDGPINCAAYAINYLMNCTLRRYDKYPVKADEDARALQTELGWGVDTSLLELEKFVQVYPRYRITAFLPNATENAATFKGAEFEYDENDHTYLIYLVYDAVQNHYGGTKAPGKIIERLKNSRWSWCHYCCIPVLRDRNDHLDCEGSSFQPAKKVAIACKHCGVFGTHTCPKITCRFCTSVYDRNTFDHRCILYKAPRNENKSKFVQNGVPADGKYPALFVYDLESRVEIVPSVNRVITSFETNEDGTYREVDVAVYDHFLHEHKANLVVFQNVFTNEEPKVYFGEDCLQRFLMFMMQYNKGNNICIAHNASGYDTRLIFQQASKLANVEMNPIMRGAKFMQLKINNSLVFIDSLLHVKGSLRSLAQDFVPNTSLRKGHFPHLFNSIENYSYCGKIPDKKYFDLSFVVKTDEDKVEFDNWYASWDGRTDWNFMDELKSYCIDDVRILKEIVKGYHDVCVSHTNMSPWFNSTAPSFVHEVFLTQLSQQLELPDPKEDMNLFNQKIADLADTKFWAVLRPTEYWFARKALRGGRTEIKKMYHAVTAEERDAGKNITYQDVNSLYPFQQVEHDFPTGTPTIHVWDHQYYPCLKHQNDPNVKCTCPMFERGDRFLKKIVNHIGQDQWTSTQILENPGFFGIVCATLVPPKDLYHPVLVCWNEEAEKCVASLRDEDHVEITTTSVEFVTALRNGYKLVKIHRYDEYTKTPSLWREKILDFYLEKMLNSGLPPAEDQLDSFIKKWDDAFGIGDDIRKTIQEGRWGNYPARKQTAKIMINSAWGKHAQRPIMPEAGIFNFATDIQKVHEFFQNLTSRVFSFKDSIPLSDDRIMYRYQKDGSTASPDLHNGYLPAALFVPAYGRMQLWEQLNKLGERVLMCDTDSIVYVKDPDSYNIPKGDMLGEWEVEKIDYKNDGIKTFVGLGPKTYSIKTWKGPTVVKAKGLSLNLATKDMVNFEKMEKMVKAFLNNERPKAISIPQQTFSFKLNGGMTTTKMLKDLKIDPHELKGHLVPDGRLFPFGYDLEKLANSLRQ